MNIAKPTAADPRIAGARRLRLRGVVALPLAVALVLGAPGLAIAAFTARTAASVTVGTYKIPAPTSINGQLECISIQGKKGAAITLDGFSQVDRATGYTATLMSPSGAKDVTTLAVGDTSRVIRLVSSGSGKGTFTFSLSAQAGPWTGPPLQRSVSC